MLESSGGNGQMILLYKIGVFAVSTIGPQLEQVTDSKEPRDSGQGRLLSPPVVDEYPYVEPASPPDF